MSSAQVLDLYSLPVAEVSGVPGHLKITFLTGAAVPPPSHSQHVLTWTTVNILAHVGPEVFPMSGLGKSRENVQTLITALVISRVRMYYPEACCKTT